MPYTVDEITQYPETGSPFSEIRDSETLFPIYDETQLTEDTQQQHLENSAYS